MGNIFEAIRESLAIARNQKELGRAILKGYTGQRIDSLSLIDHSETDVWRRKIEEIRTNYDLSEKDIRDVLQKSEGQYASQMITAWEARKGKK